MAKPIVINDSTYLLIFDTFVTFGVPYLRLAQISQAES